MKEGRKPEYQEKNPGDELQKYLTHTSPIKMPVTKAVPHMGLNFSDHSEWYFLGFITGDFVRKTTVLTVTSHCGTGIFYDSSVTVQVHPYGLD